MSASELWSKAAELRKESAELLRKAQWQAGCMANEGREVSAIDEATAGKMAKIAENQARISALMLEWAAA